MFLREVISWCLFYLVFYICDTHLVSSESMQGCKETIPGWATYLGTKTPYRIVANRNDGPIKYDGCEPQRLIGIVRHGTRTPGEKFNSKFEDLISLRNIWFNSSTGKQKVLLCEREKDAFMEWDGSLKEPGEKYLTHEGEDEMIELAERLQNRFPSLLPKEYSNNTYFFQFTKTQRTAESAKYFAVGLFGRHISKYVWFPEPIYKDPVLRFYKLCDRWKKEVKKNLTTYKEVQDYKEAQEVLDTNKRISHILGLNYTLSYDTVHFIHTTCSFETAWNKHKKSPWCSIFSKKDMEVIEYAEDLKYYWRDGYGYELNYRQACPAVKNIFSHLTGKKPKTVFYFTHSGTILKLLSHFGLYKDSFKLSHTTSKNQRATRQWRTSVIDTFGTNLVFVLFRCGEDRKVLTLHQERVITIPGCPKEDLCPLNTLVELLKESLTDCKFNEMCESDG